MLGALYYFLTEATNAVHTHYKKASNIHSSLLDLVLANTMKQAVSSFASFIKENYKIKGECYARALLLLDTPQFCVPRSVFARDIPFLYMILVCLVKSLDSKYKYFINIEFQKEKGGRCAIEAKKLASYKKTGVSIVKTERVRSISHIELKCKRDKR